MAIRRSRFPPPSRPPRQVGRLRQEIFNPTLGFNGSAPAQKLKPGFTPASQNFAIQNQAIQPRSGLSAFGTPFEDAVLGGSELFSVEGNWFGFAASRTSFAYRNEITSDWSILAYTRGSTLASDDLPSATSLDYWDTAYIYDQDANTNIAVTTNNLNIPKFFEIGYGTNSYSDFTFVTSVISRAAAVAAIDDRLVWFNVVENDKNFVTRVVWSARGAPADYDADNGAGFEDLFDMKGKGRRVIPEGDGALLFTEQEIWRARPTRDAYAFAFDPVNRELSSPYPRTVASTPFGAIFLGKDLEVYLIGTGSDVQPLGPTRPGEQSRIREHLQDTMTKPERAFGVYNRQDNRYELYFSDVGSSTDYPNRALFYDFEARAWMEQKFSHNLSYGFELAEDSTGESDVWDSQTVTWDSLSQQWDQLDNANLIISPDRNTTLFSSSGTAYRLRSDQTSDDGTLIDARWRSHGMGQNRRDDFNFDYLSMVEIEYENDSASTAMLYYSDDLFHSSVDSIEFSLSSSLLSLAQVPTRLAARSPQFEIRVQNGAKPSFSRFQAWLQDKGRWGGGR